MISLFLLNIKILIPLIKTIRLAKACTKKYLKALSVIMLLLSLFIKGKSPIKDNSIPPQTKNHLDLVTLTTGPKKTKLKNIHPKIVT
jgi:hypothetical protein